MLDAAREATEFGTGRQRGDLEPGRVQAEKTALASRAGKAAASRITGSSQVPEKIFDTDLRDLCESKAFQNANRFVCGNLPQLGHSLVL
jgi:hypothetical protein